jgi:hypothetical protein
MKPLNATFSTCRNGLPLVLLDLHGPGAELRPNDLRELAAALLRVADDADSRKTHHRGKPLPASRKVYGLGP